MKGFEIKYKGELTKAAVEDGLLTINIFVLTGNNKDSRIYVSSAGYRDARGNVWFDWQLITIGDKFNIKFTNIDHPTSPMKTEEGVQAARPLTKLESFRALEKHLTEKGLL